MIDDLIWDLVTLTFYELETALEVSCKCFLVYVAICNVACVFAGNPSSNPGLSSWVLNIAIFTSVLSLTGLGFWDYPENTTLWPLSQSKLIYCKCLVFLGGKSLKKKNMLLENIKFLIPKIYTVSSFWNLYTGTVLPHRWLLSRSSLSLGVWSIYCWSLNFFI